MCSRAELEADAALSPEQLQEKFDNIADEKHGDGRWGEHPRFTMERWRAEVENEVTCLGYWAWVEHQIEVAIDGDDEDDAIDEDEAAD